MDSARARSKEQCIAWKGGKASQRAGSDGSEGRGEGGGSVPGQPEMGNPDAPPTAGKCSPDTYKGTLAVQQNECPVMFQCSDQGNCTANDSCTANDVGGDDVLLLHLSRRVVQTSDFTNWDACLL